MKKGIIAILLLVTHLFILHGADRKGGETVTPLFNQANSAYQTGDFSSAVVLYDSILTQGYESPGLYFNLANSHYKLGNVGPSILNYERTLKLMPDHEDALFNLRMANLQVIDKIEPGQQLLFNRWGGQLLNSRNASQWAIVGIASIWLTLFALGLLIYSNKSVVKRGAFIAGILFISAALFSFFMGFQKRSFEIDSRQGIVFVPNAYVKSAPDGQSTDLFILHEGAKVNISDEVQNWVRVELPDGKEGWIPQESIAKI